jgi:hypothetical protein
MPTALQHVQETAMDDFTRATLQSQLADISLKQSDLSVTALDQEREFTASEQRKYNKFAAEAEALEDRLERDAAMQGELRKVPRSGVQGSPSESLGGNPLAVTAEMLNGVQHAIDTRTTGLFDREYRAALTTTTFGAPREWGSNILSAPRTLWETAGILRSDAGAMSAQFPKLTLPAVDAGVAEGATVVEFAASTGGTVTLKRYGRFTDFTRESLVGADAGAVVAAHRTAIARDLDSALITLVNTDAGSAIAFTADVPAAIRKSIATVADNTAAADGQIMVLANPADVSLIQNVTSTGGKTIGEDFPRFAGALVYASAAVPTGFMLVGNLATACRFWEAGGVETRTFAEVKTSVLSVTTDIIAGFGTGGISSYVQKVDVVTP